MKKFTLKGFTLIELLVVIAIIALLASIILASLNSARVKGRDANRIASLQEIAKAIAIQDTDPAPGIYSSGTTACASGVSIATCTLIGGSASGLTGYADPSTPATACTATGPSTCQYAIFPGSGSVTSGAAGTAIPNTQNYKICTWLENGSAGLSGGSAGQHMISVTASSSSSVVAGC